MATTRMPTCTSSKLAHDGRQPVALRIDLERRQVAVYIRADYFGDGDGAVLEGDLHLFSSFDHMVVGDDMAFGIPHEARPGADDHEVVRVHSSRGESLRQARLHRAQYRHVDDRGVHLLVDVGEHGRLVVDAAFRRGDDDARRGQGDRLRGRVHRARRHVDRLDARLRTSYQEESGHGEQQKAKHDKRRQAAYYP